MIKEVFRMYAVVQVGTHQYRVSEGDVIDAHRIPGEAGQEVVLDRVLMTANGSDIRVGRPFLKDVTVKAKLMRHGLGDKVVAFKFRRRKQSSSRRGHRQKLTSLTITKIEV